MWKKLLLCVCLITILCSCQKQHSAYAPPTFPEVKNIHAHRLSDELLISYPLDWLLVRTISLYWLWLIIHGCKYMIRAQANCLDVL